VVHIIGEFVGTTTPIIYECCKKVQKSAHVRKVTLDFAQATRVDTTAFACIVSFIKANLGTAKEILVTNLHDPEKNLLKMLKIEKIVRVA